METIKYDGSVEQLSLLSADATGCFEAKDGSSKTWFVNGKQHREDGPAIENANGSFCWLKNGQIHREDGPAVLTNTNKMMWYRNGQLHREDGPAIIDGNMQAWYVDGVRHRLDGPAIVGNDERNFMSPANFWIKGRCFSEEAYLANPATILYKIKKIEQSNVT